MPKGNKPSFIVRAKTDEDSDYMQTIGAAWDFKDPKREGLVVKLKLVPTNWNGDMILVKPLED